MSDTPSTSVHELAERVIKLLGVTPDENTMCNSLPCCAASERRSMLARNDAYDSAGMALDDAREAREEAEAVLDAARRIAS